MKSKADEGGLRPRSLTPSAKWTNDCSGKKDYDGPLVDISTRYWPRGGGFMVLAEGGQWLGNEARPEVRPSAHASLLLRHGDGDYLDLVEQTFEGNTEAEVQVAVERWVQERFTEVADLLRAHFGNAAPAAPSIASDPSPSEGAAPHATERGEG